jgi:outer membrane protein OmpA-like peptidoglycan-associated protein
LDATRPATPPSNSIIRSGSEINDAKTCVCGLGAGADDGHRPGLRDEEARGNFLFDGAALPDAAKTSLDQMINQLKAGPKGIFIEIEGHTDNVGAAAYNEHLGLERADVVKRYLYEQHQVPLHKINVISYGEDKPVAPNTTRAGRGLNRRVVVRLLS